MLLTPTRRFLEGGGEMGMLTRSHNWAATSLGAPESWPQSLATTLSIILNSKFPMFLFWGAESLCFYNDAYRPSLGNDGKHPGILGKPAAIAWPEIWEFIEPLIRNVLSGGEATWNEDQLLPIYRNGKIQDVYWTFSYSPVFDESGKPTGVFVTCTETTDKISALKTLNESKEDLEFALNAANLGTWDLNPATNRFKGNSRLKEWFGLLPDDEIPLQLAIDVITGNDRAYVSAAIQRAMQYESGGNYNVDFTLINPKTGKQRLVRAIGKALFNEKKEAYRFSGTLQDITLENNTRKAFEDTFQRLEIALDAGKLGSYDLDVKTGIMVCSVQCKKNYGQPADVEFNFSDLMNAIDPDYRDYVQEEVNKAIAERTIYNAEYPISWPDGSRHWISASGKPRYNEAWQISSIVGVTEDITEIKNYQRRLQASEQKLDQIISQLPIPIVLLNGPDQVIETTNDALLAFWNKTKEQVIDRPMLQVFPELKNQPFPQQWKQVLETGETIINREKPVSFMQPDGLSRLQYIDYFYQPLSNPEGERTSVLATVIDVTDKVEARAQLEKNQTELQAINENMATANDELSATNEELAETQYYLQRMLEDLAESNTRFRTLVQNAPVAICVMEGPEFILDVVNEKMLSFFGKGNKVTGSPLVTALPELERQHFLKLLGSIFISGEIYYGNETRAMIEHNGGLVEGYYNFICQPLKDADGNTHSIMMVASDVTEQVNARKSIEMAEEKMRMAIDTASIGTWNVNLDTDELTISNQSKLMHGIAADKEITLSQSFNMITPDFREKIQHTIESAIKKGIIFKEEYTIVPMDSEKVRWLRSTGKAYHDEHGRATNISGTIYDITEPKEDEQRKNDFIGMVSHELKTPLTSLKGYVQILHAKARKQGDDFTISALGKVETQINKMSDMINGFLNVSRLESGKIQLDKEDLDLDQLLNSTIEEIVLISPSHNINFEPCGPVIIYADLNKVEHVISNLLSNAIKYSPRGSSIEVKCNIINNEAQVSVKDEGIGIQQHDIERLFERYYRVESNDIKHISGFGIGLYLSAEIIQRHGGKIWVQSEIDKGSTFYFTLPLNREGN